MNIIPCFFSKRSLKGIKSCDCIFYCTENSHFDKHIVAMQKKLVQCTQSPYMGRSVICRY